MFSLFVGLTLAAPALAQNRRSAATQAASATTQPTEDHISVTTHEITLHGKVLKYEADAGTLAIKDENDKLQAHFFFIAYRVLPAGDPATRPITFVFNGGPGSASIWLHLGTVGPMRLDLPKEGFPGPPPHRVVENQDTWLDATDLVFIDPIGTGFSRAAEGVDADQFYGVDQDVRSVGNFIRLYLTRYERWSSPKFLAGESYGTTRAAGLANYLIEHPGVDLNGIVLISTVLNFQTLSPDTGNDLPYALFMPTYCSVALYHHRLDGDLQADVDGTRAAAEKWAMTDYIAALAKGKSLTDAERADVVKTLARYTGLSPDYISKARLRIDPDAFRKKLLNDQEKIIGRYDARVTAPDPNPASDELNQDPSGEEYTAPYATAFNDYVRRDLKYETDLPYETLSGTVNVHWDFGKWGYTDVSEKLRDAMLENPYLKVFVAEGYYDLATPFCSVDYTLNQLDLGKQVSDRITQSYYPSGHMIYQYAPARAKLRADIGAFMPSAVPTTQP